MRISDWSSDVCSSDLIAAHAGRAMRWANADRDTAMRTGDRPRKIDGRRHPIADRDTVLVGGNWCGGRTDGQGHRCRSEEHTSELQSLMRISYAVFCLKNKIQQYRINHEHLSRQ